MCFPNVCVVYFMAFKQSKTWLLSNNLNQNDTKNDIISIISKFLGVGCILQHCKKMLPWIEIKIPYPPKRGILLSSSLKFCIIILLCKDKKTTFPRVTSVLVPTAKLYFYTYLVNNRCLIQFLRIYQEKKILELFEKCTSLFSTLLKTWAQTVVDNFQTMEDADLTR